MRAQLEGVMERYGQHVTLKRRESGAPLSLRAFLQPVLKQREPLPVSVTPLGAVSRERWLYIGPARHPLIPGDRVELGEMGLVVQESRTVFWQGGMLYCWAMLRREKEAAE